MQMIIRFALKWVNGELSEMGEIWVPLRKSLYKANKYQGPHVNKGFPPYKITNIITVYETEPLCGPQSLCKTQNHYVKSKIVQQISGPHVNKGSPPNEITNRLTVYKTKPLCGPQSLCKTQNHYVKAKIV